MQTTFKVFISLETTREYGRGLLRGIYRYDRVHGGWEICRRMPFYLSGAYTLEGWEDQMIPDVDGIIMREYPGSERLLDRGIPIIFSGYRRRDIQQTARIITNDKAIASMAADHFMKSGFRRFAYLGFGQMYWSEDRERYFTQAVERLGYTCTVFKQPWTGDVSNWEQEQAHLSHWLRDLSKPVALFACNDDRAHQAAEACQSAGLNIPEEVAILGVDNDEFVCNLSKSLLSSIVLNVEEVGYRAAERLNRMMKGEPCDNSDIITDPCRVIVRQSSDFMAIDDPVVVEAVRYIRSHCRKTIQVPDVVAHVAVSRRGLYERFRRALNCSVYQYIKKVRVEEIEKLLLETDLPIREIAYRLNFASPDHIASYFRSLRGINPHRFRKQHSMGVEDIT